MSTHYEQPKPCGVTAKEISAFAERIATALGFEPGSDLEPIVERLNGKIEYPSFTKGYSKIASITVEQGGKFTIRLPSLLFPLQKRMLIAHELGHLFLHSSCGKKALEAFHDAEEKNEIVEAEAYEFAYGFLMPETLFSQAKERFCNDSIGLAAHFMVPEPVVQQRMENLDCQ
jgi:hypothetical protein